MTPLPEDTNMKPGAAMKPFYGAEPILMDTKVVCRAYARCAL